MPDVSLSDNPRTGGVIVCDAACRVALLPHGETKRAHPFRLAHHTAQIVRRASTVASLAINNLQAPDASGRHVPILRPDPQNMYRCVHRATGAKPLAARNGVSSRG